MILGRKMQIFIELKIHTFFVSKKSPIFLPNGRSYISSTSVSAHRCQATTILLAV
jgi:hypothetical protein